MLLETLNYWCGMFPTNGDPASKPHAHKEQAKQHRSGPSLIDKHTLSGRLSQLSRHI
jgi:hypothetical protein